MSDVPEGFKRIAGYERYDGRIQLWASDEDRERIMTAHEAWRDARIAQENAENNAWVERNGGPTLPPGLQEGGLWLEVIRDEAAKAVKSAACVQVLRAPPWLLRWLLKPWLRFQAPSPTE